MSISRTNKTGVFSGSTLKILACIFMTFDHVGLMLFPTVGIFRAIGRLAFPIFAYFIAEGCHYTKHRLKRFLMIFGIGIIYLGFYYFFDGELYGSIFLTFSVSIILIYLLDLCKSYTFRDFAVYKLIISILLFAAALVAARLVSKLMSFDYGFVGMLVPVAVSFFDFKDLPVPAWLSRLDCLPVRVIMLAVALIPLCIRSAHIKMDVFGLELSIQWFSLLVIPLLAFYNEKPGIRQLKYAFYLFYPLHLAVIEGIYLLTR